MWRLRFLTLMILNGAETVNGALMQLIEGPALMYSSCKCKWTEEDLRELE